MGNFDPSFIALVPSLNDLPTLAKDYKIYYKKVAGATPTNYTLDHSAGTYIYDTAGQLRLYARYGMGMPALSADIQQLLK
jgi:protein SCO1/2